MSEHEIIKLEEEGAASTAERIPVDEELLEIGQWYWVKSTDHGYIDETDEGYDPEEAKEPGEPYYTEWEVEWLGCVTHIGSNVVVVNQVGKEYGTTKRIHLDAAHKYLTSAPEWREVIQRNVLERQQNVQQLMEEIHAITKRLGVSPRLGLPMPQKEQSYALATLSGTSDVKGYESALVKAKDVELPKLFKRVKEENEQMAAWLKAETVPLRAMAESMRDVIGKIDDRIFNVSLYAGLTETVHRIREGAPASFNEKLHLLQRKHYMDEECLLNYRLGGMDFESMAQFDEWICETENFERIFPFPRCMVAFQVRREKKKRSWGGSLKQLWINLQLNDADKSTYLYIRNGEQLYWLGCDLEFGDLIFPEKGGFDFSQPMMVAKDFSNYKTITVADYEAQCANRERRQKAFKKWQRTNSPPQWREVNLAMLQEDINKTRYDTSKDAEIQDSRVKWLWEHANPYRDWNQFNPEAWKSFDKSYLYFDEAMKVVEDQVKYYNRVALIIQGLYDRSEVLHPHPPVKTWSAEGFAAAIELTFDGSGVLYEGEVPDFKEYVRKCNESIDESSVLIGQDAFWQRKEAEK